MFEPCLGISVLIKVEKVTSLIELHKGTGDGHTGSRHSFDVPALGLGRSGFAGSNRIGFPFGLNPVRNTR